MAKLAAHPELAFLRPVAQAIGGPAVRAMATVGGNLFAPSPYGDLRGGAAGARRRGEPSRSTSGGETLTLEDSSRERAKRGGAS